MHGDKANSLVQQKTHVFDHKRDEDIVSKVTARSNQTEQKTKGKEGARENNRFLFKKNEEKGEGGEKEDTELRS